MNSRFTKDQRLLVTACVAMYTAAYFCRLNLSAALNSIMESLSLSMAAAGFLQTVFASVYACGQLVNGAIADRVNPVRHMLTGLAGSAACNLLMGLCPYYPAMIALWAANACFQSMLWTPIMRLVGLHFEAGRRRERANEMLALTLIVGHLGAWAISGFMASYAAWRYSFIVPALIALAVCALCGGALRRFCAAVSASAKAAGSTQPVSSVLNQTGFFLVLATCVLYGFVRDGVVTWSPTILARIGGGQAVSSAAFSLILPVINFFGVLLGFRLRHMGAKPHSVTALLFIPAIALGALLPGVRGMMVTALLLGGICAGLYGANTMLTALIPLQYDRIGKIGLTAGLVDSLIYAGSALAGALGGGLYEGLGAGALYGAWVAAALAGAGMMILAGRMSTTYWASHRSEKP